MPPSSDPDHPAVRRLVDYEAGLPIVVPHHIACGQQWTGNGWTEPVFDLPWKAKTVRRVRVTADDRISAA
ncbi:hypothetical protein [Mycolicibacterium grossiae]|uniref:Uncharacterized protein n=1 Tax=Mycolicibacterium grossiae TaxID=1552759 RepID=A0A1E8QB91_9MYCO|nr:hypothetical protein [Mycolicibacterium grossiae]OFJ55304.1 hypothetical protein BEL07_02520 [Mycolicibacterium grossiae]QEM46310.1 hypothetical protein FZ046_17405 [Mycolicibacterium grossiae]